MLLLGNIYTKFDKFIGASGPSIQNGTVDSGSDLGELSISLINNDLPIILTCTLISNEPTALKNQFLC